MTWIALGLELVFMTVGFGLRTAVQRHGPATPDGDSAGRTARPEAVARGVEEPYLRSTHGTAYERWAATAGRFVLLVGRTGTPSIRC